MLVLVATAGVLMAGGAVAGTAACGGSQGQAALLGCSANTSSATTGITVPGDDLSGLWVSETGQRSWGIRADGTERGVSASGQVGVHGSGTVSGAGVYGTSANVGVWGTSDSGYGVEGNSVDGTPVHATTTNGTAVSAWSENGTAVSARSETGTAVEVIGRTKFSTAGTALIHEGKKKVTVTLQGVTGTDFVLATVQASSTVFFVKSAYCGIDQVTIQINKAPPAGYGTITVAYFVISAS